MSRRSRRSTIVGIPLDKRPSTEKNDLVLGAQEFEEYKNCSFITWYQSGTMGELSTAKTGSARHLVYSYLYSLRAVTRRPPVLRNPQQHPSFNKPKQDKYNRTNQVLLSSDRCRRSNLSIQRQTNRQVGAHEISLGPSPSAFGVYFAEKNITDDTRHNPCTNRSVSSAPRLQESAVSSWTIWVCLGILAVNTPTCSTCIYGR